MTGLELFPRGKGPSSAAPDGAGKSKARGSEEGKGVNAGKGQGDPKRKRKAAESPAAASGGQKDWLFGSPQSNEAQASGKKAREGEAAAGSSTGRGKAGHGKAGSAVSDVGSALLVEHSGRAPRLARVSFKKLSKGTLALGVIFKINEHDMVVSLPSSLTGVVRRKEVSDYFYLKAAASGAHKQANRASGGRGRYFEDASADDKPLKDFFTEGQVVRCAIANLAKEVGGRHIELSLRASVLNKGLSLSHLTKGCGVYGSVVSAEDHGYVVTLGLEGVTAFLPKANVPAARLEVGQPVEAVIQTVKAAARTVTLSAEASLVASAVATGTAFDLRSLKPGMLVDTMVDSVVSNGMLVSFLGYFAGCVDHNNMPVVSGDSKEEEGGWRSLFRPGPEPVRARVLMVDYVNKAIRLTLRPHLLGMRAPSGLPPTGALLEGEVVRVDPTLGLLLRVPSKEGDGGAGATGNAPAEKREKGQARRERRAAAAAAAATAEASGGGADAEEGAVGVGGSVGAYVHISRISDERVEHVDKSYKTGQKVRCRVTGSSLVEGWAAASLRPSVLSAAVLRYQDLAVGESVSGEIAAVEAFGLLVKLGEGVRALVPKNHLGDVAVKNPKARFKVGARVTGRVLTVDAGSSKATLTLKKSMVKDKRAPITSYQEAKEGISCTGFVTKVAPFGLHVSFYANVFGLLPAKALVRHGIHDPSEAFSAGQVVGCVVRSCDTSAYPPKLSLALDVAGKTEQMGDATALEDDADKNADDAKVACPFSPGDIVSGTVASAPARADGSVALDLIASPPSSSKKKKKDKKSSAKSSSSAVRGVLPISHLGDHASVCDETLASKLPPGTSVDKLLVLEVDKSGVPIVSLKPLLLSAAAAKAASGADGESKEAFLPREASELSPGDLVAGFVSRVESFGVFVRFLGRFSALCPRSMVADRTVEDPRGMFTEGDSVRCVVQRVDVDTGRVVVTLSQTTVSASPGLYLRSFLSEAFASSNSQGPRSGEGDGEGDASPWGRLEFGATSNAVVVALKEYGLVLKAAATKKDKGGQLMVCKPEHAMEGVEEGNEVKVRVLGMDKSKGVIDVTMDTELVKAGRSKRRRAMVPFEAGESVSAKVVLAKPDANWAVASTTDGRLLVVQVADFHCPHRSCQDAGLAPDAESPLEAKEFEVCVGEAFSPGREGYWASLEDGGDEGKANPNPYAGAVVVTAVDGAAAGKRKAKRRKARGEDLQLGDPTSEAASEGKGQFCMKEGRVPLGKLTKGAKVVCEVIAVHWDRLDVKVAVKYPKSYGSRNGREERLAAIKAQKDAAAAASNGNKKRRRDQTSAASTDDQEALGANLKQIVRIRAKIHCAAAGLPGLDAPARTEGEDGGGDDPGQLPDWHPLHKYDVGQVLKARVLRSEDVVRKTDSNLLFRLLELGIADNQEGGVDEDQDETRVPSVAWWGETPPKMGEVHRGVVTEVAKHGVLVSLSASVRGLVPLANISADKRVANNFAALFKRGMGVRAVVCSVDGEQKRLIFKLAGVPTTKVLPDASLPAMLPGYAAKDEATGAGEGSTDSPSPGDVVEGAVDLGVKAWAPPCVMVRLDGGAGMGRVCVTEVKEEEAWGKDPLKRFVDGQRVKCRVIHRPLGTKSRSASTTTADGDASGGSFQPVELSVRESRLDPARDAGEAARREGAPEVGSTAKCYVVSTGKSGCFVRLAGGVSGRVLLKLLSDRYVSNPSLEFPCGRLVAGKVLEKDEATGHVSLTLQPSVVLDGKGGAGSCLSWGSESLKKGLKLKGRVAAVKDFGIFIQVNDSEVRGMCHRSQAADQKMKDLTEVYDEGDLVKAIVLKVERSKKRLSLSLKPSYFKDDPDSSDSEGSDSDGDQESGDDEDDGGDGSGGQKLLKAVSAMDVSDDEDDQAETDEEQDDDDDDDDGDGDDNDSEEEEDDSDEEEENENEEDWRSSKRPRSVLEEGLGGGGVTGKGANAFSLDFGSLGSMGGAGASSDEDEDSDDESDGDNGGGDGNGSKSHRSRKKAKERREEEDRIAARERALQDEDGTPETAGDFERLMIAEPNNSLLWVKYMAFKLSLADVEGARSVAERGLKAVSFRLEQERYNLWVSLINLEHKYGTRATLKAVMERACQNTNPKKVHLHVAEMHEKAHEMEECEEVFQATAKKFRHSKKVWVAYQLLRLRRGDDIGARQLLQRSLQSLSRHKHVSVISRFAQNEFEHGSVERGRSVFEGLMASYPKRLDLWNVYLDKEIKAGDLRAARNLLERLTGMDFNAKRMKGVFKKYLQFEMDHGDEAGVEAVKEKATEYVASLAG